jgi:hypothetical protein
MLRGSIDHLGSKFRSCGINELELVTLTFVSWNQLGRWLTLLDTLRHAA